MEQAVSLPGALREELTVVLSLNERLQVAIYRLWNPMHLFHLYIEIQPYVYDLNGKIKIEL